MSTEERDESQPRPKKVIPSIRRENTDQEGERRPYNQGYNRPEGNNYERRPYNRGGYNSYGDNRSYGDRPSRPRTYDNRDGGYNNRITAIMVETVAMATLIVKAAITADLLMVAIALTVTTIALLTAMTVLMGTIVRTIVRLARTMKTEERLIRLLRPAKVFRVMV